MLISEELFLLLTKDDGGTEGWGTQRGYGLAGAVLADLVLAERITFDDAKDPRVSVTSSEPTGNPVLDGPLARVVQRDGKRVSGLVTDGKVNPDRLIGEALSRAEIVRVEEKRMLWLVPPKYPTVDPGPERAIRERLRTVLMGGTPSDADATLLAVLQGLEVAPKVLAEEASGLSRKQLKQRIKEVAEESSERGAVGRAVRNLNAAITAAVVIPVVTGAGS